MNKSFLNQWLITIPVMAAIFFSSCQKEIADNSDINAQTVTTQERSQAVTRPFKMHSETWYRINPIIPMPLIDIPGQIAFANVPGGGIGNATHMGKINVWFNQLAYSATGENPPAGTISAPVVDALNYSILFPGAPLPLIQPSDFEALGVANSWLQLPASVNGNIVNAVIYNDRGDAVFIAATSSSETTFISPTQINFSGQGIIVGGRGNFENATGEINFSGFFNPENANEARYWIDGSINY